MKTIIWSCKNVEHNIRGRSNYNEIFIMKNPFFFLRYDRRLHSHVFIDALHCSTLLYHSIAESFLTSCLLLSSRVQLQSTRENIKRWIINHTRYRVPSVRLLPFSLSLDTYTCARLALGGNHRPNVNQMYRENRRKRRRFSINCSIIFLKVTAAASNSDLS